MKTITKIMAYDWPTRLFHWLFALFFLGAYLIADLVDDESPLFSLHEIAGLTIGFILILRIIWGFIGTTNARFSSFKLKPLELIDYLKDTVVKETKRYLGHNPASTYAAIIMFICAAGLAFTGIMMTSGSESDFYEETHELLTNIFLITVIAHVGGIIFHQIKHRDFLWSSMFDGKKLSIPNKNGILSSKGFAGIVFIILTLSWLGYMYSTYDSENQTVNLFGQELALSDEEHENESKSTRKKKSRKIESSKKELHDDDDDD